jgi:hypothetical protein
MLILITIVCALLLGAVFGFHRAGNVKMAQDNPKIPTTKSEVAGVKIEPIEFIQHNRLLRVAIRNSTKTGITGFVISCGDFTNTRDTRLDSDDEKLLLIEPGGVVEAKIATANLKDNEPLVLSSVFFVDGRSEGKRLYVEQAKETREAAIKSRKEVKQ